MPEMCTAPSLKLAARLFRGTKVRFLGEASFQTTLAPRLVDICRDIFSGVVYIGFPNLIRRIRLLRIGEISMSTFVLYGGARG
jgi:hypothetical protein